MVRKHDVNNKGNRRLSLELSEWMERKMQEQVDYLWVKDWEWTRVWRKKEEKNEGFCRKPCYLCWGGYVFSLHLSVSEQDYLNLLDRLLHTGWKAVVKVRESSFKFGGNQGIIFTLFNMGRSGPFPWFLMFMSVCNLVRNQIKIPLGFI